MANTLNGNTLYLDTTSSNGLIRKNVKVSYIIFRAALVSDELILKDGSSSGTVKVPLRADTSNQTLFVDLSNSPIVFPNGVYVDTLSANSVATLVIQGSQ